MVAMILMAGVPSFLRDAYTVRPNRQTVRLKRKNPELGTVTIIEANWRPWSKDDTRLLGAIAPESERRTLIYPTLPNGGDSCPIAKNGDTIVDRDGVEWLVQNHRRELEGSDVICPCVKKPI